MRNYAKAIRRRIRGWLRPNPKLRGTTGIYGMLSHDPPIVYMSHWDDHGKVQQSMRQLFDYLGDRKTHFFIQYAWQMEEEHRIAKVCELQKAHLRRYPKHRYLHLCNTPRQLEMFHDMGLPAIFFNNSAAVDERVFRSIASIEKTHDAVYDARFRRYKRHELALDVPRLALIYAQQAHLEHPRFAAEMRARFQHAHWFNHGADGSYRGLPADEVARCYNQCRVGLCLSEVEGVMNASIQYLLCGLPVVSTRSAGGRDLFYDDTTALVVEDDPGAVRRGVEQMIERKPDPQRVRLRALEKIQPHRDRLIRAMQDVYDELDAGRSAADDWPTFFKDKLRSGNQAHADVIAEIECRESKAA